MNDFDQQLSRQPLRQPPAAWRADILAAAGKIGAAPTWTWRDWFWPSPIAWGALTAVWVGAFVLGGSAESSSLSSAGENQAAAPTVTPLYAFATHRDLSALLDPLN